jgi:hypothetical protein
MLTNTFPDQFLSDDAIIFANLVLLSADYNNSENLAVFSSSSCEFLSEASLGKRSVVAQRAQSAWKYICQVKRASKRAA